MAPRKYMNGVGTVRVFTLLSVIAIIAGGWMSQGVNTSSIEDDSLGPLMSDESFTEQDDSADVAPVSNNEDDNEIEISTGLIAGGMTAIGSLAIGSFFFEVMRVTVLIALVTPWLAQIKKNRDDMLTRGRILGYLEANAGIHFSALRDALGLANGVTAYHLHMLEAQGEIISWRDGKLRRYAVTKLSNEELGRIRNPIAGTRLAILEVLSTSGHLGLNGKQIQKKLAISRQLLSHHLSELRNQELVEATTNGRRPNWRLSENGIETLKMSVQISRAEANT